MKKVVIVCGLLLALATAGGGYLLSSRPSHVTAGPELVKANEAPPPEDFGGVDLLTSGYAKDLLAQNTREATTLASALVDVLKKNGVAVTPPRGSLDPTKYSATKATRQWQILWDSEQKYRDDLQRHAVSAGNSKPARRLCWELMVALAENSSSALVRIDVASALLEMASITERCDAAKSMEVPLELRVRVAKEALRDLGRGDREDAEIAAKAFAITSPEFFRSFFLAIGTSTPANTAVDLEKLFRAEADTFIGEVGKTARGATAREKQAVFEYLLDSLRKSLPQIYSYLSHEVAVRRELDTFLNGWLKTINDNQTERTLQMYKGLSKDASDDIRKVGILAFMRTETDCDAVRWELQCVTALSPAAEDWSSVQVDIRLNGVMESRERQVKTFKVRLQKSGGTWAITR